MRWDYVDYFPDYAASPVIWAAEHGVTTLLEKALHYGAHIPSTTPTGVRLDFQDIPPQMHPLAVAAYHGHDEIVSILLKYGCSLDVCGSDDYSLLSMATMGNQIHLVQRFLDLGLRQDTVTSINPPTPLQVAATYGREKIVKLLLSAPENNLPTLEQMQRAIQIAFNPTPRHPHIVSQLLEHGLDPNFRYSDAGSEDYPQTPIESAVYYEELELVKQLLEKGADATKALLKATKKGQSDMVKVLIQSCMTDRTLCTEALCLAIDRQDSTIVCDLLAIGVNCNFEEPAFICAVLNGDGL